MASFRFVSIGPQIFQNRSDMYASISPTIATVPLPYIFSYPVFMFATGRFDIPLVCDSLGVSVVGGNALMSGGPPLTAPAGNYRLWGWIFAIC